MLSKAVILLVATICRADIISPLSPNIVRPCRLEDTVCITSNIAANSRCSPLPGGVPSYYIVPVFLFEAPYFNSTFVENNLTIRNNDKCTVSEFYFNVASDTAVLALDCLNLNLQSKRTLMQHASYREDSIYSYNINSTYPLIRLTTILHPASAMDLCNAFTFADVTQLPIFHIDPNDHPTANFLSKDPSKLNIFEIETFSYRANSLARFYINRALCNFSCDK